MAPIGFIPTPEAGGSRTSSGRAPGDAARTGDWRWMLKIAGAVAAVAVLAGVILTSLVGSEIRHREMTAATERAALVAKLQVSPAVGSGNLSLGLSRHRRRALAKAFASPGMPNDAVGLVVFNRNLQAVYPLAASATKGSPLLWPALRGDTVSTVGSQTAVSSGSTPRRVLQVFVPINPAKDGKPAAIAEVELAYAPIAAAIAAETHRLYLDLLAGLILLALGIAGAMAVGISRLRNQTESSREASLRDPLTGLPNRILFRELVGRALAASRRTNATVAVMLMDLDRFKEINDTLGHLNGDIVLQRSARRLDAVVRGSDTLARLGGDEFAVLVSDVGTGESAEEIAGRLLKSLEEPTVVGGLSLRVEGSIGVAVVLRDGDSVDALLRAADVAMYSAKEARTGYAFYAPEQLTNDATSLALIGELRRGVEQAELTLFFQPKVNMATGQVDGVEGLARWYHPQRGLIGPGSFISLTEHSHLLRPVTLHLLKCALREQSRWKTAGFNLSVAVNLSPQNLFGRELPTDLQRMLDRYGVAPGELELELTEGMVMTKPGRATEMLQKLHRMGIAISVD